LNVNTFAVVSIGRQSARTKVVKDSNRPVFEENFAIGYEKEDEKSEIVIDLFEKGFASDIRIGEFRLKLAQVDPPSYRKGKNRDLHEPIPANKDTTLPDPLQVSYNKMDDLPPQNAETWANVQPQKALIIGRKGEEVGFLNILLRRELRLYGAISIHLREIDMSPMGGDFWDKPTHVVVKLGQQRHESPTIVPVLGQNKVQFVFDVGFQLNDSNNISDIFFELWQDGCAVAETRLPLYDTRNKYNGSLTFIGPFGGHDVTNTNLKYPVAHLFLESQFDNQMLA